MKKISKGSVMMIAGAVILVLQLAGFKVNVPYVNEVIESVCALLIVLGLVVSPKTQDANGQNEVDASSDVDASHASADEVEAESENHVDADNVGHDKK